jgi:hypothetical protein
MVDLDNFATEVLLRVLECGKTPIGHTCGMDDRHFTIYNVLVNHSKDTMYDDGYEILKEYIIKRQLKELAEETI